MSEKVEELTRVYTVPLGEAFQTPRYRRAKVAIRLIRDFATRHMKASEVKIEEDVNKLVWARGIRNPRSEEHTSELQSHHDLVCRLLLEKKKKKQKKKK